ncbi:MAG: hypothetical protein RR475_02235 [Clostridia bacterium]
MEPKYKYSESTVKPEAIQMDGNTVYLRSNISELVREDDQGNKTSYWSYQEAVLTQAEFNAYTSLIASKNAINSVSVPEHISQLVVGQEIADNNQLAVMEAIAELYETIAPTMM